MSAIAEVQRLTSRGPRVFNLEEPVLGTRAMDVIGRARFRQSAWPKLLASALRSMTTGLIERRTEAKLLLLAAIAGEHVLLIGPPGTGKSLLARRLASLCQGRSFEHLMTPFTTPEEILGPISLLALQEDKVVRKVEGYLPHADVAFLDEIFKASSGVLNSLVSVLNERVFDNGADKCKIPLWCLVGASNELPDPATAMDALYDRFLLRKNVSCISDDGLHDFLAKELTRSGSSETSDPTKSTDTTDRPGHHAVFDCADCTAACEAAKKVAVPSRLLRMVASLRAYLEHAKESIVISDRRLVKAMRLLQVAAFTCGAREVSELDLLLLNNVFLDARPRKDEPVSTWLLTKCQQIEDEDVLRVVQRGLRQIQAKSPARGHLKRQAHDSQLAHYRWATQYATTKACLLILMILLKCVAVVWFCCTFVGLFDSCCWPCKSLIQIWTYLN